MPFKAYDKVRTWCSTLENWMFLEYREGDREVGFYETYYGGEPPTYSSAQDQIAALKRVIQIVSDGYGECKPSRDLLKDLDGAMAIIESQAAQ
jgi:hypothetical protein